MPSIVAILLIVLLALVVAAPALVAFLRGEVGWRTGAYYGTLAAVLLGWHVGFSVGPMPDRAALAQPGAAAPGADRCAQALAAAERGGIVLDRSNPARLVVDQALWSQIPADVQAALTQCADTVRPEHARERPVEVVNRAG